MPPVTLILIIIVCAILFGGASYHLGVGNWDYGFGDGLGGIVLILVICRLLGLI
jgi:hypothetical protein